VELEKGLLDMDFCGMGQLWPLLQVSEGPVVMTHMSHASD
jgi:hypothetical protein